MYEELVPDELAADLDREYFRGLACTNDDSTPEGAIIWELKNLEDENTPTQAVIQWFDAPEGKMAQMLLDAFEQRVDVDGVSLVTFELKDLKEPAREALADSGYSLKNIQSKDIIVQISDFSSLRLGDRRLPEYIKSLSDINPRQFKVAVMTSVFHGRYGLLDDLPFLPMTRFDPDVSCCVVTDDRISGLLLVHRTVPGMYVVELFFAVEPDARINLLNMMRYSIHAALKYCDEEDRVLLRGHNKESELLIRKLFPDKTGEMVIKGDKEVGMALNHTA